LKKKKYVSKGVLTYFRGFGGRRLTLFRL